MHSQCHSSSSNPSNLPTRLLDVSRDADRIYLVLGKDLPPHSKYMTLSHCWGLKPLLKLRRWHLDIWLEQGLLHSDLSQTFQDAIFVTRKLGSSYLWIDALCIIQEDREDWQKESITMASVYGKSHLNISASAAVDGSGGCFQDRDSASLGHFVTPVLNVVGELRPMRFGRTADAFAYQIALSPLASRAWVFQERYLARRNLFFTKTQLWWECKTDAACEAIPRGAIIRPGTYELARISSEAADEKVQWHDIIVNYSKGKLTNESDRIIALAGVVESFSKTHNLATQDYLFWLWKPIQPRDLCWEAYDVASAVPGMLPSWSWLSVQSGINIKFPNRWEGTEYHVSIKTALSPDPIALSEEAKSGFLVIQCRPLLSVCLRKNNHIGRTELRFIPKANAQQYPEIDWHSLSYISTKADFTKNAKETWLLPISSCPQTPKRRSSIDYCLLLQYASAKCGVFKMTGIVCFRGQVPGMDDLDQALQDPLFWADEEVYKEVLSPLNSRVPQFLIEIL